MLSSIRSSGVATARRVMSQAAKPTSFTSSPSTALQPVCRAFSNTAVQRSADHHGPQYDPPTGWLFGVKPGEKYKNEGWEKAFFWGFCGSLIVFVAVLPFKPDTSIQTWALEEARRRLEAEGILADPFPENKE